MQACIPRGLMSHVQIGLDSQLHHHFSSQFLIDSLYNLGFCSFYSEVKKKLKDVYQSIKKFLKKAHFYQYVGNSVDDDIAIIDGLNSFHEMGFIEVSTLVLAATDL